MDNRYSETNLPKEGDRVLSPNGRMYLVRKVYGAHAINCNRINTDGKLSGTYSFQANDLRRTVK
jgi:hypothetical protein